jgi:hypothetical protein
MNVDAKGRSQRLSLCKPKPTSRKKDPATGQKPAASVEDAASPNLQQPLCGCRRGLRQCCQLFPCPALPSVSMVATSSGARCADKR